MEAELAAALRSIASERKLQAPWAPLVPGIITRLSSLQPPALSPTTGAAAGANGDLHAVAEAVESQRNKVITKLTRAFSESPPFTVVRLAELLSAPAASGYPLDTQQHILKYFNALARLVCVSSCVHEFPQTRFLTEQERKRRGADPRNGSVSGGPGASLAADEPVAIPRSANGQSAPANLHIHMVEIPWLKEQAAASAAASAAAGATAPAEAAGINEAQSAQGAPVSTAVQSPPAPPLSDDVANAMEVSPVKAAPPAAGAPSEAASNGSSNGSSAALSATASPPSAAYGTANGNSASPSVAGTAGPSSSPGAGASRSPVRRRREHYDNEESTKRPRTNTSDDDKMDISNTTLDDDDHKDIMDIGSDNILEEHERSEVCTPG